ncbi:MAG: hypothetical protein WAL84_15685 [Candidatus Dormiibacterota bacterium]
MRTTRSVAVGVGVAVAMAACGSQPTAPSVTPSQLLAAGVQSLMARQSTQVEGSFTVDGLDGSVQASMLHNGNASGTLTLDGADSPFISANGATYFASQAPFVTAGFPSVASLAANLKGSPWFHTDGSASAAAVLALLSPGPLQSTFLSGRTGLTRSSGKDSHGRAGIRLSDASGSVVLAASTPHNILEITTATHYLVGRFSDVDIIFDAFNSPVTVAVPTDYVTPDLVNMPPHFYTSSVDAHGCSSAGCTLTAIIGSDAGSGTATVTMTITNSSGARLATCTTTVVLAIYRATPTASCHARSAAWANWWNNIGGTYTFDATVLNPAYNS